MSNTPHEPRVLTSVDDLVAYFQAGATPRGDWRVGVEQEKIPVRSDGRPVPWDGPDGIQALLKALERAGGFVPVREGDSTIALERGEGSATEAITLEPGLQVELSAPTVPTGAQAAQQLDAHLAEVTAVARPLDIRFIGGGFRPFGSVDDVPWLPKKRYAVMREFLPPRGRLAHEMMKRTATVQANLDYDSEADAVDRLRTGMGVTSIVTALFAASPIVDGRPSGYKSYRAAVWLETDEARCGLLPFVFDERAGFASYAEWALDVPMFFVVREGRYEQVPGLTFRKFMNEGWRGAFPTLVDWKVHLSTLFPEVRLKTYVEVRGADAGPMRFARALPALWRGLIDDPDARAAAWALVAGVSFAERLLVRREVPRAGLDARLGGRRLAELAVELVEIARAGLRRLPDGAADVPLLDVLAEYAAAERCPADDMLDEFTRAGGDPAKLVDAWELRA